MKRFINLTNQIIDGEKEFAFYCTVRDEFETFSGAQTWNSIKEFKQDYEGDDLERYLNLIPEDFFKKKKTWSSVVVTMGGKEIEGIKSVSYGVYEKALTVADLESQLQIATDLEQYELCAKIQKKINKLKNK